MRKKWRLYADNNIEQEIVQYLKSEAGFNVLSVAEDSDLRHREDEFHYDKARQLGRYLLTHDDDFWDDRRFPLHASPGVIIIPKNEEGQAKYFPVLLRKIIDVDYNVDGGPRHLGTMKIKLSWDGMTYKTSTQGTETVSWVDLGYKRK
jgi:hypothetical protein